MSYDDQHMPPHDGQQGHNLPSNTPSWPAPFAGTPPQPPSSGGTPAQHPPHKGRPLKLCNANQLRLDIRGNYWVVIDFDGVFYLVPFQPGFAMLMEPELIAPELKRLAADQANRDVSDQNVKDALDILRTEPAEKWGIANGRTWLGGNGERFIWLDGQLMVLQSGQENMMAAPSMQPCWQPANCRPYPTQLIQGPSAWDVRHVQRIAERLPLPDDRDLLFLAIMLLWLMPELTPLALELTGESKSGTTRVIRALKGLLDPCVRDELIREHPTTVKELDALAWDHHVLAFDNVEAPLPDKVQRRMFDLLNGARLEWRPGRRVPWSSFIVTKRAWLISAPVTVVTHRELRDRTLSLELPPPAPGREKPRDLFDDINVPHLLFDTLNECDQALVLSALFALLGKVHAQVQGVLLDRRVPEGWRDFCRVGVIISRVLYGSEEMFWSQYEAYLHERRREVIEEDPVAYAILQYYTLREEKGLLEKPVGVLLNDILPYRPAWVADADWPQNPHAMGRALKRVAPLLKEYGFICRNNGKRGSNCRWVIGPASTAARHH